MNLLFIDGEVVEAATETIANDEIITIAEENGDIAQTTAQAAPAAGGSFWIMIIAMIAIMYFFMWRPESKRRKIYVPMESVDVYKSAEGWSEYADAIVGYNF